MILLFFQGDTFPSAIRKYDRGTDDQHVFDETQLIAPRDGFDIVIVDDVVVIALLHDLAVKSFPDPWDDDEVHHSVSSLVEPVLRRHNGDDLRGAKNLGMNLAGTRITGIISSAAARYREGLFCINYLNNHELANITQTAAPTVNNGVVITMDGQSEWVVTGTSYVTSLTLNEGAKLSAPEGKTLTMTVDGVPTGIVPGKYTGRIVLTV